MDKNGRMREIVNIIQVQSFASIALLKERFDVSEMTIRRDIGALANDGIIRQVPGGAIMAPAQDTEDEKYIVTQQESLHVREKLSIGQRAAACVQPNDTIILDIGSTTEYVAKFIRDDAPLTVMCYTLNSLIEVYRKKNCRIIFPGGYFHSDELMFESQEGIALIKRTRADKAFISAAGVHRDLGATTVYPYELEVKKAVMQSAKTKILIVDSSKLGKTKSIYFADISDFDTVVTDANITSEYADFFRELGIELIIA